MNHHIEILIENTKAFQPEYIDILFQEHQAEKRRRSEHSTSRVVWLKVRYENNRWNNFLEYLRLQTEILKSIRQIQNGVGNSLAIFKSFKIKTDNWDQTDNWESPW